MPSHTIVNDSQCSLLQVLDDDLVEGRETVILAIRTSDPNVLLLTNQTTTVSIVDDEGMQFEVLFLSINFDVKTACVLICMDVTTMSYRRESKPAYSFH